MASNNHKKISDDIPSKFWLPITVQNADAAAEWDGYPVDDGDDFPPSQFQQPESKAQKIVFDSVKPQHFLWFRIERLGQQAFDWLRTQIAVEVDGGSAFLWSPIFLGIGCIFYFVLPREPLVYAFPTLAIVLFSVGWIAGRSHPAYSTIVMSLLVVTGMCAAQLRTAIVDTPMLSNTTVANVVGRVNLAEYRENGSIRYTVDLTTPSAEFKIRKKDTRPKVIRLTARKGGPSIKVGEYISGRARLGPPSGPVLPGAYDFSFNAWFLGIGASGFFLGPPSQFPVATKPPVGAKLVISEIRANISAIIRSALPGRAGGLAAALIVGDRSGIDDETAESLRRSGLAHILAISGLHMALVSMTVVFVLRSIFAFMPSISLRYSTRKWACSTALVAATIYLTLSGANVSTQRAFIMVAIMLIAVLLDRRALTMRNVALAALIVLLIAPEAVLSPGFQMSFAAVAALVATYEAVSKWRQNRKYLYRPGILATVRRFLVRDIGGLALTSLIAGIATGLFAAFHFYRIAPLGLIANLLAMPLVTFIVMPSALVSAVAMPFGLEIYPLQIMAFSLEWVVAIAHRVAETGPAGNTGMISHSALFWGTAALLTATVFRSRLKTLAIPCVALACLAFQQQSRPDIFVLESGKQIGLLADDGKLHLLRPNADKFSTKIWAQAASADISKVLGNGRRRAIGERFSCDQFGCSATIKGKTIVHVTNTARLHEDCALADILVVQFNTPNACENTAPQKRPIILDRSELARFGAHSIRIGGSDKTTMAGSPAQNIVVSRAIPENIRPWTRHRVQN